MILGNTITTVTHTGGGCKIVMVAQGLEDLVRIEEKMVTPNTGQ